MIRPAGVLADSSDSLVSIDLAAGAVMKMWAVGAGALALALGGCGDGTDRTMSSADGGAGLNPSTSLTMVQDVLRSTAAGARTASDRADPVKPAWRNGSHATANDVKTVQSNLAAIGYRPGAVDGVAGARTRAAIRRYQADNGLPVSGKLSPELAQSIYARAQTRLAAAK